MPFFKTNLYTNFTLESDYNEGENPTVMTKLICIKEEKE